MTRINLFRKTSNSTTPARFDSLAWGKTNPAGNDFGPATSAAIFAALLIVCSLSVGCSSEQSKPVSSTKQTLTQPTPPAIASSIATPVVPAQQAAAQPAHRKIVRRAPVTLKYADKTSGVSFEYPRTYALKTGDAAKELVASGPVPMDFTQPGGAALAAVALPASAYPSTDLTSAFFNVSVNKNLTREQCGEFSVPQPNPGTPAAPSIQATAQLSTPLISQPPISKLMIGDLELQSSERSTGGETGTGNREATSKYYHVFQNSACYEFALQVATKEPKPNTEPVAVTETASSHIDRDEVFQRLEKILATVKFNPVAVAEVNPEVKAQAQPAPQETPAQ
jgi:hypothetical protein